MKDSAKESPAKPHLDDDPVLAARQSRLGLVLFFVYLAAYGGFMGLSAFAPGLMARPVFAGVNICRKSRTSRRHWRNIAHPF